jgi:hypothetical protein
VFDFAFLISGVCVIPTPSYIAVIQTESTFSSYHEIARFLSAAKGWVRLK